MKIEYTTFSEAGTRPYNEDYIRVVEMPEQNRTLFVLCDGMGGHAHGDVASRTVGDVFANYWQKKPEFKDCEKKVREVCHKASVAFDRKSFDMGHVQMGTTMVMASIEGNKVTIAHIGDSRCYFLRQGHYDYDDINNTDKDHVVYLTKDHVRLDFGWEVVERCFFSYRLEVAIPDIVQFEVQTGDRIFLCSDGVYKCIAPNVLKEILLEDKTTGEILEMIDSICERDGDDNYTAIMAIIE